MFEVGLVALLKSNSALMATIQSGPMPVLVPEQAVYPCLSYQVVTNRSTYAISGQSWQSTRVQFDARAVNYLDCKAVALALRNLLDVYTGTLSDSTRVLGTFRENIIDDWEFDGRCFRITIEYRFQIVEV